MTRDFPPCSAGGISTVVGGLVAAQERAGRAVVVVSFDAYRPMKNSSGPPPVREKTAGGSEVVRISHAGALAQAQDIAQSLGGTCVHVHHELLWEFGRDLAQKTAATTVYSVHVLQSEQNRMRGIDGTMSSFAQARALQECDVVHAPSQVVAEHLAACPTKVPVTTIGLGTAMCPNTTAVARDSAVLLYVGRFADINGFGEFLDALPVLFSQNPTLTAIAAGGLPGNPKAEKRWQKRWQQGAGPALADRLQFPGWCNEEELSRLYSSATMVVVPSWFETFGQVVLEAMTHGCPIVTTGNGAIAELVDAESALLIECSASGIADGVQQVLNDPRSADIRSQRARETAAAMDWTRKARAFDCLYPPVV